MKLLPPNTTKQEQNIADAVEYPVDPSIMRNFKFNPPDSFLASLIWEYGLGELLRWLPNPRRAIAEGILWQRIRGTPESLRIALSWVNLEDVYVEEEVPGQHFAAFQIGIADDVPNDLFIDIIIELAQLSSPIRTRLTRMYNNLYDVRRFILNGSMWGDILSDYSGNRIKQDGPVLSFGRQNRAYVNTSQPILKQGHIHALFTSVVALNTYRLDQVQIGVSEPHVANHRGSYGRVYSVNNTQGISVCLDDIDKTYTFVKAQTVLSDSWILDDINACLPARDVDEIGHTFILNESLLSDEIWKLKYSPINERFIREYEITSTQVPKLGSVGGICEFLHTSCFSELNEWPLLSEYYYIAASPKSIVIKHSMFSSKYDGVDEWHGHYHLDRAWLDVESIVSSASYQEK